MHISFFAGQLVYEGKRNPTLKQYARILDRMFDELCFRGIPVHKSLRACSHRMRQLTKNDILLS